MPSNVRSLLLQALTKALDAFPEGSGLANNTLAAIARADGLIDAGGTNFVSARIKRGVMTILSEALAAIGGVTEYAFAYDEIDDLRCQLDRLPTPDC